MRTLLLLALIGLTSCVAGDYDKSTFETVEFIEYTNEESPPEYWVRMDFVLFRSEVVKYPEAAEAFLKAALKWSEHVPIEVHVSFENEGMFPWLPLGGMPPSLAPDVIKVHFKQLDYMSIEDMMGGWESTSRTILIDAPDIDDPDQLYQTALHEIGHALGLPHIVSIGDSMGVTGDISVRDNANEYVMYPGLSEKNVKSKLSDLEIGIAEQYVLDHLVHIGVTKRATDSCLTHRR